MVKKNGLLSLIVWGSVLSNGMANPENKDEISLEQHVLSLPTVTPVIQKYLPQKDQFTLGQTSSSIRKGMYPIQMDKVINFNTEPKTIFPPSSVSLKNHIALHTKAYSEIEFDILLQAISLQEKISSIRSIETNCARSKQLNQLGLFLDRMPLLKTINLEICLTVYSVSEEDRLAKIQKSILQLENEAIRGKSFYKIEIENGPLSFLKLIPVQFPALLEQIPFELQVRIETLEELSALKACLSNYENKKLQALEIWSRNPLFFAPLYEEYCSLRPDLQKKMTYDLRIDVRMLDSCKKFMEIRDDSFFSKSSFNIENFLVDWSPPINWSTLPPFKKLTLRVDRINDEGKALSMEETRHQVFGDWEGNISLFSNDNRFTKYKVNF